jgi:hypothetical protein
MVVNVYSDLHIGSPIEMLREEVLSEPSSPTTILLGDIIDGANCKKKEIPQYKALFHHLRNIHGTCYVLGNHERMGDAKEHYVLTTPSGKKKLFVHSHMQANPKRWSEYCKKPWGAGFFKRRVLVPLIKEAEEIKNDKFKQPFLIAVTELAISLGCDEVFGGHFHPDSMMTIMFNGITVNIVERGKTVLNFK